MSWKHSNGAANYKVRFRITGTGVWSTQQGTGGDTSFLFTNLSPATQYDFAVKSICTDGTASAFKKKSTVSYSCTLPTLLPVTTPDEITAKVNFTSPCSISPLIHFRYKRIHALWKYGTATSIDSIFLHNLIIDSTYLYQVSTCADTNNRTPATTFVFKPAPNIVLIIADDARFDTYSCNNGPPWFSTPNIDRIANEGVNFKNYFGVCSICAPSRASMATGLYPLKNGVTDNNGTTLNSGITTINQILHEHGYYTAILGKDPTIFEPLDSTFDFWMVNGALNQSTYYYNGSVISIPGFGTNVLTDSVVGLIQRTNDPMFVWLSYHVPHGPLIPESQYAGMFNNDPMPITSDTAAYTVNYPSFLDDIPAQGKLHGQQLIDTFRNYFEVMMSLDSSVGRVLNALQSAGKLNNTLVIYVSDNGHLFGEHGGLYSKRLAYDPSIRIPLFIRYPSWFTSGSVINNQMALNIDVAPTILDVVGITSTNSMDGVSLRKLYNGQEHRSEIYYQYLYSTEANWEILPGIRAVRSSHFKYIYYGCSNDTTEEFFNLFADPDEMINQVNNPQYASLIQTYRNKLANYRMLLGDTINEVELPCFIKNPTAKLSSIVKQEFEINVYPNPSDGSFSVSVPEENFKLTLMDETGKIFYEKKFASQLSDVVISQIPKGIYFLVFEDEGRKQVEKVVVQ